jgi:hypothetical protein
MESGVDFIASTYRRGTVSLSQLCDPLGGHSSVVELRDDDRLAE